MQKPPPPIRDKKHLAWLHELPCCISGSTVNVVAHHLLRTPEKAMGRKSGDNHTIPLASHIHMALHRDGNETRFLKQYGIDGPALARRLWEVSGDIEAGQRVLGGGDG